jgi:hypothetical protein
MHVKAFAKRDQPDTLPYELMRYPVKNIAAALNPLIADMVSCM